MKRLLSLILSLVCLPLAAQTIQQAHGVYRQPASSARTWAGRGINLAQGYESNGGAVTIAQWDAAWTAAGCNLIREPSDNHAGDAANVNLLAILYSDEPDNDVVTAEGSSPAANAPARVEAVYAAAEAWCAARHLDTPGKPLIVNLGLEQIRWTLPDGKTPKVDYARLCKPFDLISVDYHPCQRNVPISDYGMLIDKLAAIVGQPKIVLGMIESVNEQLKGDTYAATHAPTVADFNAEAAILTARKMGGYVFPQRIGDKPGGGGFSYDATTPEIQSAIFAWAGTPKMGPYEGKRITIEGYDYYLRSK